MDCHLSIAKSFVTRPDKHGEWLRHSQGSSQNFVLGLYKFFIRCSFITGLPYMLSYEKYGINANKILLYYFMGHLKEQKGKYFE